MERHIRVLFLRLLVSILNHFKQQKSPVECAKQHQKEDQATVYTKSRTLRDSANPTVGRQCPITSARNAHIKGLNRSPCLEEKMKKITVAIDFEDTNKF